jgi:hypothetical protein
MVAFQGVWHDCQLKLPVGATIPPRNLSLQYTFLWKTATAQIPFPSGLTIAPPNHHPNQDCHKSSRAGTKQSHAKHST